MSFATAKATGIKGDSFVIIGALALLLLIGAFLVGGPILSILAINGLVGTEIPVTFKTWLCSFWLFAAPGLWHFRKSGS